MRCPDSRVHVDRVDRVRPERFLDIARRKIPVGIDKGWQLVNRWVDTINEPANNLSACAADIRNQRDQPLNFRA